MIFERRTLCAAAAALLLGASSLQAAIVINEVAFDEPSGDPDWIELFNNGGSAVSIDNWSLTDQDAGAGNEIQISLPTPVPAGAYVVIFVDEDGTDETDFSDNRVTLFSGTATTVSLASTEDELSLYSSTVTLNSTTIVDFLAWFTDGSYGGTADQTNAVTAGIWTSGEAVSITDSGSSYTVGRAVNGGDANVTADFVKYNTATQGASNTASGGGGGTETACSNGADDDNDGQADCADSDCASDVVCFGQVIRTPKVVEVDDAQNPFSPMDYDAAYRTGRILFNVHSAGVVKTLRVANVRGETVRLLINSDIGPGGVSYAGVQSDQVSWDGRDDQGDLVPVGIYILFLEGVDPDTGDRVIGRDTIAVGRPF